MNIESKCSCAWSMRHIVCVIWLRLDLFCKVQQKKALTVLNKCTRWLAHKNCSPFPTWTWLRMPILSLAGTPQTYSQKGPAVVCDLLCYEADRELFPNTLMAPHATPCHRSLPSLHWHFINTSLYNLIPWSPQHTLHEQDEEPRAILANSWSRSIYTSCVLRQWSHV